MQKLIWRTRFSKQFILKSTPLHLAVANQHINIVEYLLSLNVLIDVWNMDKLV